MEERIKEFIEEINGVLQRIELAEDDKAYFEGKRFAYECVLEMIEQENK